jgi:serine/threonine protein kinase
MELATNGELFSYIQKKKKLSEQEASRIFAQLLLGIEYIHQMGIVHRDLKPENLLLGHDFRVKIADFGLSNIYRKGEQLKTACGSPCYAAPEMVSGKIYDGKTVDTWSCGVILYTLLCGCLPFEARSTNQVYDKILLEDFNKPKHLSKEALSMLERILDKDPATRIKIWDIKKHPFFVKYNQNLKPSVGIIVGKDRIPIDESLVTEISQTLNIDPADIRKSVEANSQNTNTTTYKLLMKKRLIEGKPSIYDINSEIFDPSLLKKPQIKSESMEAIRQKSIGPDRGNTKTCLQVIQRGSGNCEDRRDFSIDKNSRDGDRADINVIPDQIRVDRGNNLESRSSQKQPGSRNNSKRRDSLQRKNIVQAVPVPVPMAGSQLPRIDSKENSGIEVFDRRKNSGVKGVAHKGLTTILKSINLQSKIQEKRKPLYTVADRGSQEKRKSKRSVRKNSKSQLQNMEARVNMTVLPGHGQRKESLGKPRPKTKSHRTNYSVNQGRPGDFIEELMMHGRR